MEVNVAWSQEQQARRPLPIAKIPRSQNPSDLRTKNIPVALLEKYSGQLNIYFATGRAAVAQQRHARCVDSWLSNGDEGIWTREHRTPRRSLFTLHRVSGGDWRDVAMNPKSITRGAFVGTGETLQIEDDDSAPWLTLRRTQDTS